MNIPHVSRRMRRPQSPQQAGFTLIEIMVGMVIALIATIVMMQALVTSEQRTRTSNSGNDSLSSGAVMLHLMQRDLMQAGYGINSLRLLGCNLTVPTGAAIPLAPVTINPPTALVPAADANTDRLLAFYGNDNGQPEGNSVATITGATYTLNAPASFAIGDFVVAFGTTCGASLTLARVTNASSLTVTVDTPALVGAKVLYNMGRQPKAVAYAVRNGALTSCDFMNADCRVNNAANWTAVAGNVVSLRAQYGRDTAAGAMDGFIDLWDQSTPPIAPMSASCGWARTAAVRFVLVARSSQYETQIDSATGQRVCDPITTQAPAWLGSTGPSPLPIDLSASEPSSPTAWQCYRYKTFETIAPSRNIVWMGTQTGC
jgi:type IV pilus assembly protein PilW